MSGGSYRRPQVRAGSSRERDDRRRSHEDRDDEGRRLAGERGERTVPFLLRLSQALRCRLLGLVAHRRVFFFVFLGALFFFLMGALALLFFFFFGLGFGAAFGAGSDFAGAGISQSSSFALPVTIL